MPYHRRSSGHHTIDKRRPIQVIVLAFLGAIVIGTGLLLLPAASTAETSPLEALFTSVSAICVTGLIVVDTVTHWTTFGQVVILVLIQLGGFGVMTAATVVSLVLSRQLGLETKYVAAVSTRTVRLGDVGKVLRGVARTTVIMEVATALMLTLRWWISYDEPFGRAVWLGVFHSVSAFNNAGFALFTDSLIGFESDPLIILPISAALIIGGLGFPVLLEIMRHYRWPHRWSLQARATAGMSLGLVLTGWLFVLAAEWGNPGTLGPLSVPGKILGAFFQGVVPRTAGFNSVDIAEMNTGTWFGLDILMFIGGGSAGTAGGIKVTTVAVLGYAIWSELRGDKDVRANRWRLSPKSIREALTVAALSAGLVVLSTGLMTYHEPFTLDEILFEVISAFGTVGLSTGITADLSAIHQVLLMALMFVGRLGPITLGSSLALRTRGRDYRNPETTMIIG
ncbi:MAG: TrkH family potassium uptake protein [Actinobacteria bacterium]|nr:TrkH family potassium uptake protein [Actinomycetota bacterium]